MKHTFPIIALLLLAGWAASYDSAHAQNSARLDFFKVDRAENDMVITWKATTETGVSRYELQRKTRFTNNQYVVVSEISPQGTGQTYRIMDDQVYKVSSEQVDYRLEVVYTNGVREELANQSVNYTPTTVRRTWGSIKAMFQ